MPDGRLWLVLATVVLAGCRVAQFHARPSVFNAPQVNFTNETQQLSEVAEVRPAGEVAPRESGHSGWLDFKGNRVRLYGFPRLDVIFTDSRLAPNNQFPFFVVSEDPTVQRENDEELDIHPRLTRVGIDIERDDVPLIPGASVAGKVEIDFQNGGSESRELIRMRHAYLRIEHDSGFSVLAGQTWDVISPLFPSVNGDSLMWNAGNIGDRRPQLRFAYETAVADLGRTELAFALARRGAINNRDLDGDGTADGIDSGLPLLEARLGVEDVLGGHVGGGVWGHYGWEDADRGVAGETDFTTGGFGADLAIKVCDRLSIAGEAWYGHNLDDVRGGIGQGINAATGEEITSRGGWIELRVEATDWYAPAVGYTVDDPVDNDLDATLAGGAREKNQAVYLSNHFDLGGGVLVGLEYIYWKTWYQALENGDSHRVDFWLLYKF